MGTPAPQGWVKLQGGGAVVIYMVPLKNNQSIPSQNFPARTSTFRLELGMFPVPPRSGTITIFLDLRTIFSYHDELYGKKLLQADANNYIKSNMEEIPIMGVSKVYR